MHQLRPIARRSRRSRNTLHNDLADATAHGHPAEASHQARSEAHPDAVAAAGDQAAADVDARAVRPAEPGDGREPDARGGPDRGAAAGRSRSRSRKSRRRSQQPKRPTPGTTRTTNTSSATTSTTATGRGRRRKSRSCRRSRTRSRRPARSSDHLMWQLSMQTDDAADARHRRGDHRQPRRRRLSRGVVRGARGDGAVAGRRRRARAAARAELRPDRRRRARPAGVPAAAAAAPRPRGHADREDRHRAPAAAAEPSGAGDRAQARA